MLEDKIITLPDLAREINKIKKQLYILTETQSDKDNFSDIEEEVDEDTDIEKYNFLKDGIQFLEGRIEKLEEEKRKLLIVNEEIQNELQGFKYDVSVDSEIRKARNLKIEGLLNKLKITSTQMANAMFKYENSPSNVFDDKCSIAFKKEDEVYNLIKEIKQLLD